MPSTKITPVHRSDGSGTTHNFTLYLGKADPTDWTYGNATTFPTTLGAATGNGNQGVAQTVQSTDGAIGYVDYATAKAANLTVGSVKNKAGQPIAPTLASASAAVAAATVNPDLTYDPTDASATTAYPITSPTWIVVYKTQARPQHRVGPENVPVLRPHHRRDPGRVGQRLRPPVGQLADQGPGPGGQPGRPVTEKSRPVPSGQTGGRSGAAPEVASVSSGSLLPHAAHAPWNIADDHDRDPPRHPTTAPTVATLKASRPRVADKTFRVVTLACGLAVLAILALIAVFTTNKAFPAFRAEGLQFLTSRNWNPSPGKGPPHFGGLKFIYGTIGVSLIALAISVPVSLGMALFLTEVAPRRLRMPVVYLIDLLAAIPSVVFGLWGVLVLVRPLGRFYGHVSNLFAGIPLLDRIFRGSAGRSFFTAGLIVAMMITPIITSLTREVFATVPSAQKEAALALGATRWEMIRASVLAYGRSGVVGAVMLGLGRAMGETIAVALVIGSIPSITWPCSIPVTPWRRSSSTSSVSPRGPSRRR